MQTFFIMNLGKDRVILGYPWLEYFNPQLNWKTGVLETEQQVKLELVPWRKVAEEAS
jgi:hypothetical protein